MVYEREIYGQLFRYDGETGKLWRRYGISWVETGTSKSHGYLLLTIANQKFRAHRVAWFVVYGKWPEYVIDHVNGNPADNRLDNLRDVTKSENQQNSYWHRWCDKTGFDGF